MTTGIQWTDETWNPVTGCTKVSAGCDNCYAERLMERFQGRGSFEQITVHPNRLEYPLKWKRPRRIFVNSMSDLFHAEVPRDFIAQVFAVMRLARRHTFQVLTKRPGRMRLLLNDPKFAELVDDHYWEIVGDAIHGREGDVLPAPNVWLGVSVEDQHAADTRIPELVHTPAAIRFLSCEPLIGPVHLVPEHLGGYPESDQWTRDRAAGATVPIDWVIIGGESGPLTKVRPTDLDWVRTLINECRGADVACFVKQLGRYPTEGAFGRLKLRDALGGDINDWPDEFCVREFPAGEAVPA